MLELIALGIDPEHIHSDETNQKIIFGNCNLSGRLIKGKFPEGVKAVYGHLDISHNELNSLANCPEFVSGTFCCINTRIRNFRGGPRYVDILCTIDNPLLESLDYAPAFGRGMQGDLLKTSIPPEEVLFYMYSNEKKIWNAYFTFEENVAYACREFPEVFDQEWELLHDYRASESELRGRAVGNGLNII